ncbi:hypothetical protein EVAR_43657_1 [Eumeta japonica]|uniref:Uncharacterized protein n=1 Tax=Eumeta variegata TaxID=151549 RepID=A0A4C1XXJ0_EUMVA|nr:hypothetical protein EVAR_43657_1 [Eumeta japonica]
MKASERINNGVFTPAAGKTEAMQIGRRGPKALHPDQCGLRAANNRRQHHDDNVGDSRRSLYWIERGTSDYKVTLLLTTKPPPLYSFAPPLGYTSGEVVLGGTDIDFFCFMLIETPPRESIAPRRLATPRDRRRRLTCARIGIRCWPFTDLFCVRQRKHIIVSCRFRGHSDPPGELICIFVFRNPGMCCNPELAHISTSRNDLKEVAPRLMIYRVIIFKTYRKDPLSLQHDHHRLKDRTEEIEPECRVRNHFSISSLRQSLTDFAFYTASVGIDVQADYGETIQGVTVQLLYTLKSDFASAARGRPIIVEWERDARHSAGLSLVRDASYYKSIAVHTLDDGCTLSFNQERESVVLEA